MLLLWRLVRLSVMLLVNYTRGSRVLQVLGRRMTLLLVLWMMRMYSMLLFEVARHLATRHADSHGEW